MNGMIIKLLQNSLMMSAAILLLMVLSRLLHRKTSAAMRLVCWMAVAISLLVPIRPPLYTLTVPGFVSSIAEPVTVPLQDRAEPEPLRDTEPISERAPSAIEAARTPDSFAAGPSEPLVNQTPFDVSGMLPYIWAFGFSAVILFCAVKHILFLRTVRRWGRPVSGNLSALVDQIRHELGLKRPVRLLVSPVITAPVLVGLLRPMIVLPDGAIEDSALRFILTHEALHCKRGDIGFKALSLLTVAVHWFNPFVYLMHRAIAAESETACDLAVLRHIGMDQRFQYGETVLLIAKRGTQSGAVLSSTFNGGSKNLKKRLKDIVASPVQERTALKKWISAGWAAALFAGLLLTLGLTGFTVRSDSGAPAPPGPEDVYGDSDSAEDSNAAPLGLKDVYQDYFLIGTCGSLATLEGQNLALITRDFNAFTFENDMKPQYIQPEEGTFTFTAVDAATAKLRENNIAAIGHSLAFHQQTPDWMWDSREKAQERLEAYIEAVVRHSGPHLASIDVVCEAFVDGAGETDWRADLRQSAGWYTVLGADFIEIAFRKADEVRREIGRPDLKLYYNDYSLGLPSKAQAVYNMVTELRAQGVPIDGVGMEAHYNQSTPLDSVRDSLELFNSIPGLEVSISELDVAISSSAGSLSLTADEDALQATMYAQLFSLYKEYAKGPANPDESKRLISRVTVWGTTDDTSWRGDRNPLLFDRDGYPKGAYCAAMNPEAYT